MNNLRDIKPHHTTIFVILALFILGFIGYSNILHAPFVFDDNYYIADNPAIKYLSNFNDINFILYGARYITFLSFAINYYVGGLNTFGYHLVNVVIHIINAMLVYYLVNLTFAALSLRGALAPKQSQSEIASALSRSDITRDPRLTSRDSIIAFSVSLIFLVHPIQTQAVTYISQRFTSLATFFYLLAIVLYVKARLENEDKVKFFSTATLTFYFLSLISAILAMKTKEISFTLPFIILLYEWTFFSSRSTVHGHGLRFFYLIPYLLTLIIIPLNLIYVDGAGIAQELKEAQLADLTELPAYNYLLIQFSVIVTYIRLLFFSLSQHFYYDYPISASIFEIRAFLSLIFLLLILSSAVYLYKRSWTTNNAYGFLISFGILWFFITLSVESFIIPIRDVIFEHRIYLPSIGFMLAVNSAVVCGFEYLEKRLNRTLRIYLLSLFAIIVFIFLSATYNRNDVWKSELTLWMDEVKKSPSIERTHNGLGVRYAKQGLLNEATEEYLTGLRINPYYAPLHNNLGKVYHKQGKLDEAINEFMTALKLKPYNAIYHLNLGNVYYEQGMLDKAIQEYLAALKPNPDNAKAHYRLGLVYYKQGRLDESIKAYSRALKLKPDYMEAHYNLGVVYKMKGLKHEARKEFEEVLRLSPNNPKAYQALIELR